MTQRNIIHVGKLNILSVGPSIDGTPSHHAHAIPTSSEDDEKLWDAHQWRDEVTVRCAMLDVHGVITKARYEGIDKIYELKVDNIVYETSNTGSRMGTSSDAVDPGMKDELLDSIP